MLGIKRFLFIVTAPILLLSILLLLLGQKVSATTAAPLAVGDPLPRVTCSDGYSAYIFAEGLSSPDGLAFNPLTSQLVVAEESAGRVSVIPVGGGTAVPFLDGLSSPEGIDYDAAGNLYVVEDVDPGRLVRYTSSGISETIKTDLVYPEGIVAGSDGLIYVTESDLEALQASNDLTDFQNAKSYISSIDPINPSTSYTRLYTATPELISVVPPEGSFNSFSGLTEGSDGLLYVGNELSGVTYSQTIGMITGYFTSTKSVFTLDPQTKEFHLFVSGLKTVEGVRFAQGNVFPLYVAEEDTSGAAGNQTARLSRVAANGSTTTFCTGLLPLEDVLVDQGSGVIYLSENNSGYVIRLVPPTLEGIDLSLTAVPNSVGTNVGDTVVYTVTLTNSPTATMSGSAIFVTAYLPDINTQIDNINNNCGAALMADTIIWNVGTLAAGATTSCAISAQVHQSAAGSGLILSAEVSSANETDIDSTPGNFSNAPAEDDEAQAVIMVGTAPPGVPDVTISKTADVTSTLPGATIIYTIEISNVNDTAATGIVVSDMVDSRLTITNIESDVTITPVGTAPNYSWQLPNLAPTEKATITLTAVVSDTLQDATINNTAIVSAVDDGNAPNNSSTVAVNINTLKVYLPLLRKP